jgi:hypothetical protein
MSAKALRLAEWTALKDYIEECREELAAGIDSQACRRAMKAELPPPPYVKPGVLEKLRRSLIQVEHNGTRWGPQVVHPQTQVSGILKVVVFLVLVLFVCTFLFLGLENNRSRTLRRTWTQQPFEKESEKALTTLLPLPLPETATTTIRHPPTNQSTSLRRRTVRSHPIYQYANLEEALHHCSVHEIRLRLQNGEDVNKHWPYLIYALAITPPTTDTPKRLEVARLCLDFGADVNALKGWNGQSALMIAIHFGSVDVAKLLIANGANVSYSPPDSHLTALLRCIRLAVTGTTKDALEIMRMLFDYGADPNQEDRNNETALHKLIIEAWLQRDINLRYLVPIALCLLDNGARLPTNIKGKYLVGNPLWDVVWSAARSMEEFDDVGGLDGEGAKARRREEYYVTLYDSIRAIGVGR